MATHSSILAWRIPGTGEPGVLPSMRLHRVGHDWSDLAAAAACRNMTQNYTNCFELKPLNTHTHIGCVWKALEQQQKRKKKSRVILTLFWTLMRFICLLFWHLLHSTCYYSYLLWGIIIIITFIIIISTIIIIEQMWIIREEKYCKKMGPVLR